MGKEAFKSPYRLILYFNPYNNSGDQTGSEKRGSATCSRSLQTLASAGRKRIGTPQPGSPGGPLRVRALTPRNVLLARHFCPFPPLASPAPGSPGSPAAVGQRKQLSGLGHPAALGQAFTLRPPEGTALQGEAGCVPLLLPPGLLHCPKASSVLTPPPALWGGDHIPARLPSAAPQPEAGGAARSKCLRSRATVGSTVGGWSRRQVSPVGASPGGPATGRVASGRLGSLPSPSLQRLGCSFQRRGRVSPP